MSNEITVQTEQSPALMEEMSFEQLTARVQKIEQAIAKVLKPGVDVGVIPGTQKPSLLKPGAEKLAMLFLLDSEYQNEKVFDGNHLTVHSTCTLYHIPTGRRVGSGSGMCSTRESKYALRRGQLVCPKCGKATIIKPKPRPGRPQSYWCNTYNEGCGSNFKLDDPAITEQSRGDVANDKLPDSWNTVTKIAQKRAKVDAVLGATGASQFLTQDVEDTVEEAETQEAPSQAASAPTNGQGEMPLAQPKEKPKTAQKAKSAPASDTITAEQVEEIKAVCTELGYDADEIRDSYRERIGNAQLELKDFTIGMFKNFMQSADTARKRKQAG